MKHMPSMRRLTLLTLLASGLHGAAQADVYDDLRARWIARPTSGPALSANDPDIALQVNSSSDLTPTWWNSMDRTSSRTTLWADLPLGTVSANVTASMARLIALANAYNSSSSAYYQNATVLQAVLSGMDWLVQNHFSSTGTGYDNWWDWQIGAPTNLNSFMFSLYSQLGASRLATYLASVDHFMPDPTVRTNMDGSIPSSPTIETGANRTDKALIAILRGILGKSSAKIAAGRDAIPQVLPYVTSGDGFYDDGTFIQHTHEPYVGSYGTVLLSDINKLYYILDGSSWPISNDPNYLLPAEWALNAFAPFIYNGAMMDNQRGRAIARQFTPDHVSGRGNIFALAELTQSLPAAQAAPIKSAIKGWVQRDTSFGSSYFTPVQTDLNGSKSSTSTYDIALVKDILNDASVTAAPEPAETRYFPSGDRAVSRRDGFAFALSTFSKRMSAFEYTAGENARGWWTGIGMTYLYNSDLTQYGNNYWATINMWRLPGTTTDHSGSGTPVRAKHYANTKTGTGGAELNREFATASMEFATSGVTGSTLVGKKAWFMFGDRIVAAGAGITTTDGASVETIVDNRALNGDGDNTLTVNNVVKSSTLGWTEAMASTSWAHLAGNSASGSDIGYVFPDAPTVTALREARTGKWSDINTAGGTTVVSNNYLSLAIDHGVNPTNATYSYIILPNRDAAATQAFAAANPIKLLERSVAATAYTDTSQGVTGIVFWSDASKTVNSGGKALLTSDKKAVVTMQQTGNDLQLAVADPTQLNTGVINLELNRAGHIVSNDSAITISQTSPTIKMAVNVNGTRGKSFNAHFALLNTTTLSPSADALVRGGSYAATNNGTLTTLMLKQDTADYSRKSLLKFDLSSVSGTVSSATLQLTPVGIGATAPAMTNYLYQTSTSSWTETGVTWNNAPANGSLLASWTVPAVNTAVQLDLTSAVTSALSGSKILSMKMESAANYGSDGYVNYASKEYGTVGYRPTLTVISY